MKSLKLLAISSACAALGALFGAASAAADNTLVVQTMFERGRQEAIDQVSTLRLCSMNPATPADQREWLMAAKDALIADLQGTPHELLHATTPTCASTDAGEASPVRLSVPVCVTSVTSTRQAAMLLLGFSAKHLGVSLDRRTQQLAQAVFDATRSCDDEGMRLDSGAKHTCLVRKGALHCWGDNRNGQTSIPDLVNVKFVALGEEHTCALDSFGVKCWGANNQRQTQVPGLYNVRALAAGYNNTCAIHEDGVQCWGESGGIIDNVPQLSNPREIAVGKSSACALHDSGVKCWGAVSYAPPSDLGADLRDLRFHWMHACVRVANGTMRCWGQNHYGQTNVPAGLEAPRAFEVGSSQSCAVLYNRVRCWGENSYGQSTPPQLRDPILVSAGDYFSCGVDAEGVKCWGSNDVRQLAVPPEIARFEP